MEPDLVFVDRDRGLKLDRYRHFGVAEYWIVDPEARSVEVWDLGAGAAEAVVHGPDGVLTWSPRRDGPELEIDLRDLLGDN